ncbi:MAG TPA: histidine kinase [Candidatus Mediterraneibacter merdipullorum]|nr:histidine kinase [Candidatus Mediterraneibacter merdipullorum]
MKFKYKITIILCCILIVTTGLISGLWYRYSKEMIVENAFESTNLLLRERDKILTDTIESINNQIGTLAYNNNIVDRYLNNKWENKYLNDQATERMETLITNIYTGNPEIYSIEISNYSGDSLVRGQKIENGFLNREELERKLEKVGQNYLILGIGDDRYHPDKIVLFRFLTYYGKNIGYCAVTLESREFEDTFEDAFHDDALILIGTQDGTLLYASDEIDEQTGETNIVSAMEHRDSGDEKTIVKDEKGEEWLLVGNREYSPFKMSVAVPVAELLGNMGERFLNVILITVLMLGMLLGVVYILTRWIGRNIDILTEAIQTFGKGRMDTELQLEGKDEFAKVSQAFNIMTQDIKQLTEDIREKEKEKMALEIRSLQGQINLHFLFNTLNTIKNLCYIQRVTNVEHLVDAFMKLLHISMEQDKEFVTLKTELQYTECYIEIYKYKSVYPIRYYMDIEPETEDARILKFMIQPIVENAIVHGLEGNSEDQEGVIFIKAKREEEDLVITVLDNGRGFDTRKIAMFNGIGLSNTEKRIKLHYGEQYGITAESIEGISTSITVRVPFRKEQS